MGGEAGWGGGLVGEWPLHRPGPGMGQAGPAAARSPRNQSPVFKHDVTQLSKANGMFDFIEFASSARTYRVLYQRP